MAEGRIPPSKAQEYYKTALAAAKDVIENGPYKLMLASEQTHKAYADNFYKAVCPKDGNTEVIWCRDYVSPGQTHQFTKGNLPKSIEQDTGSDRLSVLLNLVEAFEPLDATEEQKGTSVPVRSGTPENPEFFTEPTELFMERDPRLMGSLLCPELLLTVRSSNYKQDSYEKKMVHGLKSLEPVILMTKKGS